MSLGLSSNVTLFNGFARPATLAASRLEFDAGQQVMHRARQTVVFQVISGYLAVIEADAQLRVSEESREAERQLETVVGKLVDGGRSPISDLYQQEASVARAEVTLVASRRTLALAKIDLTQTLQLDPLQEYDFVAPELPDSIVAGPEPDLAELQQQALENRSDLKALELRLDSSHQSERIAAASRWPSLSLSADYRTSYSTGSFAGSFLEQIDDRRSGSVGIGMSMPLFDRFSTRRAIQRSRLATGNERLALEDLQQTIAFEVRRTVLDEISARESLNAARAQWRAANRALESTQQRYAVGASTLHEVTLSRADMVQAQSTVVRASYILLWQQFFRDFYVGVLDPETTRLAPTR
jgi:outer membrane protein